MTERELQETSIRAELAATRQAWAEKVLAMDVDGLMALYLPNATLKPTLSPEIRTTSENIRAYFEGTPDHPGFAKKGWEGVEFSEPASITVHDKVAIVVVKCHFTKDGATTTADKTFVYVKQPTGWMIQTHHSSLEFTGAH